RHRPPPPIRQRDGDNRSPERRSERPEPGWRLTEWSVLRASPGCAGSGSPGVRFAPVATRPAAPPLRSLTRESTEVSRPGPSLEKSWISPLDCPIKSRYHWVRKGGIEP